ncbi:L,D-transpeptidase [Cyanobium sp. ATX-6F1]|uniref:L,D-transpeptidase n=1 Tax=Cyanobium sp. ATX-6F1 TaxID=3137388 RepID=UPI0039BDB87D
MRTALQLFFPGRPGPGRRGRRWAGLRGTALAALALSLGWGMALRPALGAPAQAASAAPPLAVPAKAPPANPLTLLPPDLQVQSGLHLVLDRRRRRLLVINSGALLRQFPVAVGMPGWETPAGNFSITDMRTDPVWEHPTSAKRIAAGADNPLGSRWIGFHLDCNGRKASDGDQVLDIKGCVAAGFHGTPTAGPSAAPCPTAVCVSMTRMCALCSRW